MKRIITLSLLIGLVGCSAEEEKTEFFCTQAAKQGGETGFWTVGKYYDSENDRVVIGYRENSIVIEHNECGPAVIDQDGSATTYSYYQYGVKTEEDGAHALKFYTDSTLSEALKASRIERSGLNDIQDGLLNDIRFAQWSNEDFNAVVTAEDAFDGNTERKATVTIGNLAKEKKFNTNTAQFDCTWFKDGGVEAVDAGCSSEAANDLTYLRVSFGLDTYLQQLDGLSRTYETDKDELDELIDRYFK